MEVKFIGAYTAALDAIIEGISRQIAIPEEIAKAIESQKIRFELAGATENLGNVEITIDYSPIKGMKCKVEVAGVVIDEDVDFISMFAASLKEPSPELEEFATTLSTINPVKLINDYNQIFTS